jgi:hypothetical protein
VDHSGWFCASYPSYSLEARRLSSVELPSCVRILLRTQLGVHPRVAVGLAAPAMDLADLLGEEGILPTSIGRRPGALGVVTAL